jgi:hypothetical protein
MQTNKVTRASWVAITVAIVVGMGTFSSHASDPYPSFVGRWTADGATDKVVAVETSGKQLKLTLTGNMGVRDGQAFVLDRVDDSTFSATDADGVTTNLVATSPGHAMFSMKGGSAKNAVYIHTGLSRQ